MAFYELKTTIRTAVMLWKMLPTKADRREVIAYMCGKLSRS